MITTTKLIFSVFLSLFSVVTVCVSAYADFVIHSKTTVYIELTGYNGLADSPIFKGNLTADRKREIDTTYRGLALLVFAAGQRYPVIIGDDSFTLKIENPAEPPSFADSGENDFFYRRLAGKASEGKPYPFALLMIQAKQMLESSHSIHTIEELIFWKEAFHEFVGTHYETLKHSDRVRRLLAQYFMMHEYVNYHTKGAPGVEIKAKYQGAVLAGVGSWLEILKPHIPEHEILNYCVSLYYNRSMVTLASLIIENFRNVAYCPGEETETFSFPDDLTVTGANRDREWKLSEARGAKIIAFVSDDCPVSMVETICEARKLAYPEKGLEMIVATLQKLSAKHLTMSKMVSTGSLFFINDENWRKDNLATKIKLPLFLRLGDPLD